MALNSGLNQAQSALQSAKSQADTALAAAKGLPNDANAAVSSAFDQAQAAVAALRASADGAMSRNLGALSRVGVVGQDISRMAQEKEAGGLHLGQRKDDGLPKGPGFAYLNHIFKRGNRVKEEKKKKSGTNEFNIYSDQPEAVKTAIQAMGIYSDKNPGGMPIDIRAARKLWFGEEAVDGHKEAQWRTLIEMGDSAIDPKRIRKFANYDGSLTWEILNQDKTVMSRFTMGEYAGTQIFTQGGYSKFAEMLNKFQAEKGQDPGSEFDSVRGSLVGR